MKNKAQSIVAFVKDMQKEFITLHLDLCNSILTTYKGTLFRQELLEISTFGGLMLANACFAPHKRTEKEDWNYYSVDFDSAGEEEEENFHQDGIEMLASRFSFFRVETDVYDGNFDTYFSFNKFCEYPNGGLIKKSLENIILYAEKCKAMIDEAFTDLGKEFSEDPGVPRELFRGTWKDYFISLLFDFAVEGVGCLSFDIGGLPERVVNQIKETYSKLDSSITTEYYKEYGMLSVRISPDVSIYADSHEPLMFNMDDYIVHDSYKFMLNPDDLK